MFRKTIQQTPFTSEFANEYFKDRIVGDAYSNDYSFLATMRALLDTRMPVGDKVAVGFVSYAYNSSAVDRMSDDRIISDWTYPFSDGYNLVVVGLTGAQDANDKCMDRMDAKFVDTSGGSWQRLMPVTEFFRKQMRVSCFVEMEQKRVLLVVSGMDMRKMHYLQCAILAIFPWYFDKSKGITADEMELVKSLRETSEATYLALLEKLSGRYDFRESGIRKMLDGFETRFERAELTRLTNELERRRRDIESYKNEIASLLRTVRDLELKSWGIRTKVKEDEGNDSEIMEYFLGNKSVQLDSVTDDKIQFHVKTYLRYFDRDNAATLANNRRSCIYQGFSGAPSGDDMELLFRALFVDPKPKLRVVSWAKYVLYLGGNVDCISGATTPSDCLDALPNTHIQQFHCMGQYTSTIAECMLENDYIGSLEQCVASAGSLNMIDYAVMSQFPKDLFQGNRKCVELPDGKIVSAKDAIEWLKKQEADNVKTQEETKNE